MHSQLHDFISDLLPNHGINFSELEPNLKNNRSAKFLMQSYKLRADLIGKRHRAVDA
ncbi:hypothetical protein PCC6912_33620 [Chlorogloeopsis fritschii PCC 6912]|uniref:Uncharacterized protein n=1 Tax=Chlorogloeopsis fritschii PCC 6912 TaxID=211165 RepID=A0A3S1A3K3_CHLFR|nr:hypothetical protein PCC6912_33620 [Chlorogloeopsis fritschii PCC 6912]